MIVQITAGGKFDRAFAIDRALIGIVLSDYALKATLVGFSQPARRPAEVAGLPIKLNEFHVRPPLQKARPITVPREAGSE